MTMGVQSTIATRLQPPQAVSSDFFAQSTVSADLVASNGRTTRLARGDGLRELGMHGLFRKSRTEPVSARVARETPAPIIRTEGSGRPAASQPRCRPLRLWHGRSVRGSGSTNVAARWRRSHGPSERGRRLDAWHLARSRVRGFQGTAAARSARLPDEPARRAGRASRRADADWRPRRSGRGGGARGWRRLRGWQPIAWVDERYPALLNCVADPPPVLWVRGRCRRPGPARRGDRRIARGDAVRARGGARGWPASSPSAASWSSAAWRAASTRRRIAAAWRPAGRPSRCSAAGSTSSIRRSTRRWLKPLHPMGFWSASSGRRPAAPGALSAAESDHQRDLAGRCRRRSLREERFADYRPMRPRAGPRRHGGARQRAQRPEPRLARSSEGRRKGRRDCGRYLEELGWPGSAAAAILPADPARQRRVGQRQTLYWRIWSPARSTGWTSSSGDGHGGLETAAPVDGAGTARADRRGRRRAVCTGRARSGLTDGPFRDR